MVQTELDTSQGHEAVGEHQNGQAAHPEYGSGSWSGFTPPEQISISHPWISRLSPSAILHHTTGSDQISTIPKEIYGNNIHPIAFRIGNGGAGYTGILRVLCLKFIWSHGRDFRIAWVANHSRHTQAALLADVVQVAFTYEPEMEEVAVGEGWCRKVCGGPAFWDHFVLVGPDRNPAGVEAGCDSSTALDVIAKGQALFHTRGDGSATFEKEQLLWKEAGRKCPVSAHWLETHALPPYAALEKANQDGAYLLTDRATFLTAKKDGVIPNLVVFVEGEEVLLNPCSALINTKVENSPEQRLAVRFAEWLAEDLAQSILRGYGRVWEQGMPLFTGAERKEFGNEETLAGRNL